MATKEISIQNFNWVDHIAAHIASTPFPGDDMGAIDDLAGLSDLTELEDNDSQEPPSRDDVRSESASTAERSHRTATNLSKEDRLLEKKRKASLAKKFRQAKRHRILASEEKLPDRLSYNHISESKALPIAYNLSKMETGGLYLGKKRPDDWNVYPVDELQRDYGFDLIPWDGLSTRPIVDNAGRVVALLAGRPRNDKNWAKRCYEAAEMLEKCREKLPDQDTHRRGAFPAEARGISHGGGQRQPGLLVHDATTTRVLDELREDENFKRFALFAAGVFKSWFPRLDTEYKRYLDRLLDRYEHLEPNWPGSPWACATWNFGPKTECFPHVDFGNLAFGLCAITCLGRFDSRKGGHLVLWDFKTIIEYPAGSTVFIPSGCVKHSNTPIGENETRYSFTQYTAGGIFRWVDLDFQKVDDFKAKGKDEADLLDLMKADQVSRAQDLFCTLDELLKMHAKK